MLANVYGRDIIRSEKNNAKNYQVFLAHVHIKHQSLGHKAPMKRFCFYAHPL